MISRWRHFLRAAAGVPVMLGGMIFGMVMRRMVAGLLWVASVAGAVGQSLPGLPPSGPGVRPVRERRTPPDRGVKPGDVLPALTLYDAHSRPVPLALAWSNRPALLVTGSLTCPIARSECPRLQQALAGLERRVNVVVVYTVEAHPQGDPNPYGGNRVTPQVNVQEGIEVHQPTNLAQRLVLMHNFVKRTGLTCPVLADGMDDRAWQTLGRAPNLAVLVGTNGVVAAKQIWLDPEPLRAEVDKLTAHHP